MANSYLAVVLMLTYRQKGLMAFSSSATHRTSAPFTFTPIMHHAHKDPAMAASRRGEGPVLRPKAWGINVAEKSLVGRPCLSRLLEKPGTIGCPPSPFPPLQAPLEIWAVHSCYKNSWNSVLSKPRDTQAFFPGASSRKVLSKSSQLTRF